MTYGIEVIKNNHNVILSTESIVGLSYIQTNDGTQGVTVDLSNLSQLAKNWGHYFHGTPAPGGGGAAVWHADTHAKQVAITDNTLNKNNLFLAISSNVTSLNGVLLEPWAMPGYFCIYDQTNHHIYYGQGSGEVTCFLGATK